MPPKGYIKNPKTGKYEPKLDDLGTPSQTPKQEYPIIILSYKDSRGRSRQIEYIVDNLNINESVHETFKGPKKQTYIHISLDADVVRKT